MGFGHRVYRAEDPRARVLRRTAKELGAPRYEVALALENAALAELRARRPDRVLETNVEFWAAIVLDFAQIPAQITPSMFTCARTAGWAAHVMEQKLTGRLIRPSARYVGPAPATGRGQSPARRRSSISQAESRVASTASILIPDVLKPATAGSAAARPRSARSRSPPSRRRPS